MKVWEIVRVIEESPVRVLSSDLDLDIVFVTTNGYQYSVFFDCGEPDYVNWITDDNGERIDFWPKGGDNDRARSALAYLAGNLLHLPHVSERLKEAVRRYNKEKA